MGDIGIKHVVIAVVILAVIIVIGASTGGKPKTSAERIRDTERTINQIRGLEAQRPDLATLAEFNSIQAGMTYEQVTQIIGSRGVVMSSVEMPGVPGVVDAVKTEMYSWEGLGTLGANMNATFHNGVLQGKAQFGLQ